MGKHRRLLAIASSLSAIAITGSILFNGSAIRDIRAEDNYSVDHEELIFDANSVHALTKNGNEVKTSGSKVSGGALWYQGIMGEPGVYNSTPIQNIHRIEVTWDCNAYAGLKLQVGSTQKGSDVAAVALSSKSGGKVASGTVFTYDVVNPGLAHYWSFAGVSGLSAMICVYKIVSVKVIYSCF